MIIGQPTTTTTVPKETRCVPWRIADFRDNRKNDKVLEAHKLQFEMGASIGLPIKLIGFLRVSQEDEKAWIGVYVKLVKTGIPTGTEVLVNLKMRIGTYFDKTDDESSTDMMKTEELGYSKIIPQEEDGSVLPLEDDGSLFLELAITLININPVVTLSSVESKFEARFRANLQREMKSLLNHADPAPATPMMVKLMSCDGKEILANRGILAARSPVFRAMFESQMSEVQQGVISVKDIDGKALEALLSFMHTGTLPPNWKDPEIIEGFTIAASKYMLEDLVQFLDHALGFACTKTNCVALFDLANKLGLKTAEMALKTTFQSHLDNATCDEIVGMLRQILPNVEMAAGLD